MQFIHLARAGVVPDAVVGEVPNRLQPGGPEAGGVVIGHNYVQLDYASDSGEDDDWWNDRNYIQSGVKVEVGAVFYYLLVYNQSIIVSQIMNMFSKTTIYFRYTSLETGM